MLSCVYTLHHHQLIACPYPGRDCFLCVEQVKWSRSICLPKYLSCITWADCLPIHPWEGLTWCCMALTQLCGASWMSTKQPLIFSSQCRCNNKITKIWAVLIQHSIACPQHHAALVLQYENLSFFCQQQWEQPAAASGERGIATSYIVIIIQTCTLLQASHDVAYGVRKIINNKTRIMLCHSCQVSCTPTQNNNLAVCCSSGQLIQW